MDSEAVLCYARDAALGVGAKLSVIHVILASELGSKEQREFEEVRKARGQIAELQCAIGCHAAVSLELGPIKKALLDAVRQSSADVLVIGRSHSCRCSWPHAGSHLFTDSRFTLSGRECLRNFEPQSFSLRRNGADSP